MNVTTIGNSQNNQPSFGALRTNLNCEHSSVIYKGLRKALSPNKNELVSNIIKSSFIDDISFTSKDGKALSIDIDFRSNGQFYCSPSRTDLIPDEKETQNSFAEKINNTVKNAYKDVQKRCSGGFSHIF